MSELPLVSMTALWPDLAEQRRAYEVVLTVPRPDGGDPSVPRTLPARVVGAWSANQTIVSITVLATYPSGALAAVEALLPDLARAAGSTITVKAADPADASADGSA
jgi:hypothetical protein